MKQFILLLFLSVTNLSFGAAPIGTNISNYPNTNTLPDSALFLVAITNEVPKTNYNIKYSDIRAQLTNGLATVSFVNANITITSNGLAGLISTTSNAFITIIGNTSNGVIAQIIISSNNLLGTINFASNFLATSSIAVKTNQTMLILQQSPLSGSQWFVGSNSIPTTNEARSGFEVNLVRRSLRFGEVAGGVDINNLVGFGSNYWNNTNLGVCSVGFGSNAFVVSKYASVLGGIYNAIRTNADSSVIGGGINNLIDTNAVASVIAGGGRNLIRPVGLSPITANNIVIGGGSNNVIGGTSIDIHASAILSGGDNVLEGGQHSVIAGGQGNEIQEASNFATMSGGLANRILANGATAQGGDYSTLSGGRQNIIRGTHGVIAGGRENSFFGNASGVGADYNVIGGGASNNIGVNNFPSLFCVVGGGHECDIQNDASYSVVAGGRQNNIGGNENTNCTISGGYLNIISGNVPVATIGGGQQNIITSSGDYGTIPGGVSNTVSASHAFALGNFVTNNVAASVMIANLISWATNGVVTGSGNGNTNYTLQTTSPKVYLGSSNVNFVAIMQGSPGKIHNMSISITNLSAIDWGFSWSQVTNRVRYYNAAYGTNAPSVLTNGTELFLDCEINNTNITVRYNYFTPAGI